MVKMNGYRYFGQFIWILIVHLGGFPAYKFIYYKDNGKYQVMEIGTIVNENVYQINYVSTTSKFFQNYQ